MKQILMLGIIVGLLFLTGCSSFGKEVAFVMNNTDVLRVVFDEPNYGGSFTVILDKELCHPITCECAINTSTPCALYCMECVIK